MLRESLYSFVDDARAERVRIDVSLCRSYGLDIATVRPSRTEAAFFVELAGEIDDGEAESLAIARHRGLRFLTDDNAAIRVAGEIGVRTVSILDLLQAWSADASPEELCKAARSLFLRGRFAPPKTHPLASWYSDLIRATE